MKQIFAVPTANEKLTQHFGHSEKFAVVEVENNKITKVEFLEPPIHEPGSYPAFLAEKGVQVIIAGGMGQRAIDLFTQNNIEVFLGIDSDNPTKLVELYLEDKMKSGSNKCDDDHHGHGDHHNDSNHHLMN